MPHPVCPLQVMSFAGLRVKARQVAVLRTEIDQPLVDQRGGHVGCAVIELPQPGLGFLCQVAGEFRIGAERDDRASLGRWRDDQAGDHGRRSYEPQRAMIRPGRRCGRLGNLLLPDRLPQRRDRVGRGRIELELLGHAIEHPLVQLRGDLGPRNLLVLVDIELGDIEPLQEAARGSCGHRGAGHPVQTAHPPYLGSGVESMGHQVVTSVSQQEPLLAVVVQHGAGVGMLALHLGTGLAVLLPDLLARLLVQGHHVGRLRGTAHRPVDDLDVEPTIGQQRRGAHPKLDIKPPVRLLDVRLPGRLAVSIETGQVPGPHQDPDMFSVSDGRG